jgi:hypothetical protein
MKRILYRIIPFAVFCLVISFFGYAQFPPAAGQPGTTAMYVDSSAFVGWAKSCHIIRGFVNIEDTTVVYNGSNRATYGSEPDAVGKADNLAVSLGDGGSAILTFDSPIVNGTGPDFAVFENSLNGSFLELGFVEVSSDGLHFFRFPAVSLTQFTQQISSFGTIDPTKIDNLAGKYQVLYGTPFDLDILSGTPGLDLNNVSYLRIVDVVGDINPLYATRDSMGNIVNDPWPTPYNSCGFDLDAVGVIHALPELVESPDQNGTVLYRNPVDKILRVKIMGYPSASLIICTMEGMQVMKVEEVTDYTSIDLSSLPAGIYLGVFGLPGGKVEIRKIVKK